MMTAATCLVLLLALSHAIDWVSATDDIPRYELDALRDLYNSTDGRNWTWKGPDGQWDFDSPYDDADPCAARWQGVTCLIKEGSSSSNSSQYFVEGIDLPDYRLRGTIPDSIGNFSELTRLDLQRNLIFGSIPDSIFTMHSLKYLSLFENILIGSIPASIGSSSMSNLSHLNLGQNIITNGIPASLSNLTLLSYLDLSANNMSSTLPDFLGRYRNLSYIDLSGNRFTGTIPESLCNAAALTTLRLSFNLFEGSLPRAIGDLSNLTELQLQINRFNGSIPSSIGLLDNLQLLYIDFNQLTGTIPESIGSLRSLRNLSLDNNELVGTIPSSVSNLSRLSLLSLQSNHLSGTIPSSFGRLPSLTRLNLLSNRLTGTIPSSLGGLHLLYLLLLDQNKLHGALPDTFGGLSSITALGLSSNSLSGTVPSFIADLKHLYLLLLNSNHFVGSLPPGLGLLPNLTLFNATSNQLTGNLELFSTLSSLVSLGLGSNQFTGTIPQKFGDLRNLSALDLSCNMLHGSLPASICRWTMMVVLIVSQNYLTSILPECIGGFSLLQALVGDDNLLTGPIPFPREDHVLYRSELILSDNTLTGTLSHALYSFRYVQLTSNELSGPLPMPNHSKIIIHNTRSAYVIEYLSLHQCTHGNDLFILHVSSTIPVNTLILSNNKLTGSLPSLRTLELLVSLILSNNKFSGGLDDVFPTQSRLETVQLSHNQLTGTIPGAIFRLPHLESFSIESNCIDGPIPRSICDSTSLKVLDLNGLHTASSCQTRFLSALSKAYISSSSAMDDVYDCLFSMPNITTLHLSGLGIQGTLPSDLQISYTLEDLSLSYNFIPGLIPDQLQQRPFKSLDLSNNRLTGTLRTSFGAYSDGRVSMNASSLSLTNNRLSGLIPSTIKRYGSVSMLLGNSFNCRIDKRDLPQKDSDAGIYDCGSNSFNVSYFVWLGMVAVVIITAIVIYKWQSKYLTFRRILGYVSHVWAMMNILDTITSYDRGVQIEDKTKALDDLADPSIDAEDPSQSPRKTGQSIMYRNSFVPFSERLYYFRKWNNYVDLLLWVATACCAYLVLVMVPLYLVLDLYYSTLTYSYAYTASIAYLSGATPAYILIVFLSLLMFGVIFGFRSFYESYIMTGLGHRTLLRTTSRIIERFGSRLMWYKTLGYLAVIAFNFSVVIGVNVAFVFTVLHFNGYIVTFAQLLLSAFKLFWNGVVAPLSFRMCFDYLSTLDRNLSITEFFGIQLMVSLSNNVLIPFISLIFINPNCFYYFFIATVDPVQSSDEEAVEYLTIKYDAAKAQFYPQLVDYSYSSSTEYQPPFVYNYQCSFSILKYYSPAFVYVCILASFVNPLLQLTVQYVHSTVMRDTLLFKVADLLLPRILRPVTHANVHDVKPSKLEPYFIANQLIVTVLTFYGIFLSFGIMFPPLGVAVLLTMYSIVYFAKYKVGRFLCNAYVLRFEVCFDVIEAESKAAVDGHLLNRSVLSLTALSCLFYTFFLFDILGDDVGFYRSYWVLVVMPLVPVVLVAANNLFMDYLKRIHSEEGADTSSSLWASSSSSFFPAVSAADDKKKKPMSSTSSYDTSTVNSGRSTFRVQQIDSVTMDMRNTMLLQRFDRQQLQLQQESVDWAPEDHHMPGSPTFQMNPLQQQPPPFQGTTNRQSDSLTLNRPSVTFALDDDQYPRRRW